MNTLFSALPLLRDTLFILMFFFILFAIAGLQLFSGILKTRCINPSDGIIYYTDQICGYYTCPKYNGL